MIQAAGYIALFLIGVLCMNADAIPDMEGPVEIYSPENDELIGMPMMEMEREEDLSPDDTKHHWWYGHKYDWEEKKKWGHREWEKKPTWWWKWH